MPSDLDLRGHGGVAGVDSQDGAGVGADCGTRAVGWDAQRGEVLQLAAPEGPALLKNLGSPTAAVPHGVVGVVDAGRRAVRIDCRCRAAGVGASEVVNDDVQGSSVARDVMGAENEDVLILVEMHQERAEGAAVLKIEGTLNLLRRRLGH